MLTQYNTWILIGVMQEKSSRVVEVLLATVRPIQLLGGKVLGIGLVALGQATLIVGFALIVAAAVGSDLLHGSAPLVLVCQLLWLVLGYAFYCWVYAAGRLDGRAPGPGADARPAPQHPDPGGLRLLHHGGQLGQRRTSSSRSSPICRPTAPFCMPVLVGLSRSPGGSSSASVLITIAGTVGMAIFAARIYAGPCCAPAGRVRLRDLVRHAH